MKYEGQMMSATENKSDLKQDMESLFTVKSDVNVVVIGFDTK